MAFITNEGEDREAWLMYAIEFAKRGLWPVSEIEVHGPHAEPGNFIWGDATVLHPKFGEIAVTFRTQSGVVGHWSLTGFTVRDEDGDSYPILRTKDLPAGLGDKLKCAKVERARLKEENMPERGALANQGQNKRRRVP